MRGAIALSAGFILATSGACWAETYACPALLSDARAAETGATAVWQMVDTTVAPGAGQLLAVEIFDGPPTQLFQLAPAVTATADGTSDVYDLDGVVQAFIRCRYDGATAQFVLAARQGLKSCQVLSKDGAPQAEVVCE
jgi:hypothetical protein